MQFLKSSLVFLLFSYSATLLAVDPIQTSFLSDTAVGGYDTVAYFEENAAIKGKKEFEHEWMDANWRFSSAENLALFIAAPHTYAPQFGGYCSYAVGLGSTAPGDPQQFSIVENKLYLNYSNKTKVLWEDDRDQFISTGQANWPGLIE